MVTSFADGAQDLLEQAIVANATGMRVAQRGMLGYNYNGHVDQMTNMYDVEQLKEWGGIVDYVGSTPGPGVFVFATHDDPKQRHYPNLYKLVKVSSYTPYHLCHFEVPLSVARAVLFQDAVMAIGQTSSGRGDYQKSISKLGKFWMDWLLHDLRSV